MLCLQIQQTPLIFKILSQPFARKVSESFGIPDGAKWKIGIPDPEDRSKMMLFIPVNEGSVATSGDYERYFLDGDKRIHHIINPSTGQSATGIQSVSVIAPDGIDSDALSTTVFVLGIEKGLALINQLEGIDAIIIDGEGKLHYSAELLMPVK